MSTQTLEREVEVTLVPGEVVPEGHARCDWEKYHPKGSCSEIVAKTKKNKWHIYYLCERHGKRYEIAEDF